MIPPLHESRSDRAIIFDLASRLGLGDHFFGGDVEAAFNYQLAPSGLTVQDLRDQPAGIHVEARTRYRKYAETDARTGRPRGFETPSGKVEIYSTRFAAAGYPPLPVVEEPAERSDRLPGGGEPYPLLLTFSRLVQYCNEQHRHVPRLRRQAPEPFLEIHPATAEPLEIQDGDAVILETALGSISLKAKLSDSLDPRVVATQYGWWQGCRGLALPGYDPFSPQGANANLLIPDDARDPISGSVPHRAQRCRVRRLA